MGEPIVFLSHSRVLEGKLADLKEYLRRSSPLLAAEKPETLALLAYLNEDGTELTIAHVFADAAAMDAHMGGAAERVRAAYEFIETIGFEVYGRPGDRVLQLFDQVSTPGFTLNLQAEHIGGFLRTPAGLYLG